MTENRIDRELSWDDEISEESSFILLEPGDYNFKITGFERGRYEGGTKLPACNKATVKIEIDSEKGKAVISHMLFLHTITEGLLSDFFIGIGQKKKGEPVKMNWNAVVGSTGRCKVGHRTYTNMSGEEVTINDIKKFYPREIEDTQTAFTPGAF